MSENILYLISFSRNFSFSLSLTHSPNRAADHFHQSWDSVAVPLCWHRTAPHTFDMLAEPKIYWVANVITHNTIRWFWLDRISFHIRLEFLGSDSPLFYRTHMCSVCLPRVPSPILIMLSAQIVFFSPGRSSVSVCLKAKTMHTLHHDRQTANVKIRLWSRNWFAAYENKWNWQCSDAISIHTIYIFMRFSHICRELHFRICFCIIIIYTLVALRHSFLAMLANNNVKFNLTSKIAFPLRVSSECSAGVVRWGMWNVDTHEVLLLFSN